jgi:acylphosphatase
MNMQGWVRNLPNGDVEVHAEGDAETLVRFQQAISGGPSFSYVSDVQTRELAVEGFTRFSIER